MSHSSCTKSPVSISPSQVLTPEPNRPFICALVHQKPGLEKLHIPSSSMCRRGELCDRNRIDIYLSLHSLLLTALSQTQLRTQTQLSRHGEGLLLPELKVCSRLRYSLPIRSHRSQRPQPRTDSNLAIPHRPLTETIN
jgi:hypothetical protein